MLLLVVAVAPGLFWLWYFRRRDQLRPEPRFLVRRLFFLGAAAGVVAAALESLILSGPVLAMEPRGRWAVVATASTVGIVEEGMKFLVVYVWAYRHAQFDEVLDGIVYAVAAAMGFATLENIAYVLQGGIAVGVLRAVLSVPGHALFASLMGFNMGMARFAGRSEWRWLFSGLTLAVLAHAAFNAVLLSQTVLALAVVPLVYGLWRRTASRIRQAQALDERRAAGR